MTDISKHNNALPPSDSNIRQILEFEVEPVATEELGASTNLDVVDAEVVAAATVISAKPAGVATSGKSFAIALTPEASSTLETAIASFNAFAVGLLSADVNGAVKIVDMVFCAEAQTIVADLIESAKDTQPILTRGVGPGWTYPVAPSKPKVVKPQIKAASSQHAPIGAPQREGTHGSGPMASKSKPEAAPNRPRGPGPVKMAGPSPRGPSSPVANHNRSDDFSDDDDLRL